MSIKDFEDKRWRENDHGPVFRHRAAVDMIGAGRVLDFGCGEGVMYDMLLSKKVDYVGVDISEEAVRKCRIKGAKAQVITMIDEKLPFGDDEFDYIIMLDVLEHSLEPEKFLAEAKRVAKNIIISVPNFSSLPARLQVFCGDVPENNRPNKGHVFWFNWPVLNSMLESLNCSVVAKKTNTFWEDKLLIGVFFKKMIDIWPNLFALSFVLSLKKDE